MKTLTPKQKKEFENTYDSMYNLNSLCRYEFEYILTALELNVKLNYDIEFVLNDKTQKFKLKKIK